jgi:hypothetical protein
MVKQATRGRQRPLATLRTPVKATIYRGKFRPFAALRYLDTAALRRVTRATIEIGTVEAPGVSCTLAAEIRNGMITRLRPLPCAGCTRRRASQAKLRRLLVEATRRIEALGLPQLRLPMPLKAAGTWGGKIGPIVIVIDEGIPCIWIYIGDTVCVFCVFDVIAGLCL